MKRVAACLSLLAFANAQPAVAACWKRTSTEAAQVKQFDIMLMVSTLRCHGKGVNFADDYNRFVIAKRAILRGVGDELVSQFKGTMAVKAALNAYDKMGVVMANKYGNGIAGMDCEAIRGVLALANDTPATRTSLLELAQRTGIIPALPDPSCEPVVATQFVVNDAVPSQSALAMAQPAVMQSATAQPAVVQLASLPGLQSGQALQPIVAGSSSPIGAQLSPQAAAEIRGSVPAADAQPAVHANAVP